MMHIFKTLSAALIIGSIFIGCNGEEEKTDYEATTDTLSSDVSAEMALVKVSIPKPTELTAEISNAGFNFNKSILSSPSKAGTYSTNFQKAANLGVYGADLGYVASYNQSQDAIEYFSAVNKLAKDLGLSSAFDENLIKSMGENMGKKDTLLDLIDQAYNKAERNLRSNQRVSIASVIAAGGWIEGVYITTQLLKDSPKDEKNKELYTRVWSHVSSFHHIIEILTAYKNNPDCAKMLEELKGFQPFIDQTHTSSKGVFTQEDIKAINEQITTVRNRIVG